MTKEHTGTTKDCKVIDFKQRSAEIETKKKEEIIKAIIKNVIENSKSF